MHKSHPCWSCDCSGTRILIECTCKNDGWNILHITSWARAARKIHHFLKKLEKELVSRAEFHAAITLVELSIVQGDQATALIHLKLLPSAIDRRNIVASSASIGLPDAFQVARREKEIGRINQSASSFMISNRRSSPNMGSQREIVSQSMLEHDRKSLPARKFGVFIHQSIELEWPLVVYGNFSEDL